MTPDSNLINTGTGRIPQFGEFLPLVNQVRRISRKRGGKVKFKQLAVVKVPRRIRHKKLALRSMTRSPGLSAPFRPLNTYCTKGPKVGL